MSDLFNDLASAEGVIPSERARSGAGRTLPKRFYTTVAIEPAEAGFRLLLDGRPVRTPARHFLAVSSQAVAEALAEEWRAQTDKIDPVTMPLNRLVNAAIDGVAETAEAVVRDIAVYAQSDMLCYRAEGPDRLVARQSAAWDPVVAWAESRIGRRFRLAAGVMHVAQEPDVADRVAELLPRDALRLAALHSITSLTGSVLLALSLAEGQITPDQCWQAAHVDEDWNAELWGLDAEAAERLAYRRKEFDVACLALRQA